MRRIFRDTILKKGTLGASAVDPGLGASTNRPWLFDQLRARYEHPMEVEAYVRQVALGLLHEERAILERAFPNPARLLDLGCGAGREAFALEAMGHEVVAADISREMITAAKRIAARRGSSVTWVCMPSPVELPFPTASFDGVVALAQLLSHIPDSSARVAFLSEVRRVLKPGGLLVATFTTRKAERELTGEPEDAAHPRRNDAGETAFDPEPLAVEAGWEEGDIFVWDPSEAELDEPLFFHLHTEEEIRAELTAAGLELIEIIDPRSLTDRAAWDAHRYPFVMAAAGSVTS